jgi:hypothetical protein
VCLGILALAVAFHLGAQYGQAHYVDHSTTGVIGAEVHGDGDGFLLLDNGEVWHWNEGNQEWYPDVSPPMPVSEIKFWHHGTLVDMNNQIWHQVGGEWYNRGIPPGLVAAQPTTWSQIKAGFGE